MNAQRIARVLGFFLALAAALLLVVARPSVLASTHTTGKIDTVSLLRALGNAIGGSAKIATLTSIYFDWHALSVRELPKGDIQSYGMRLHLRGHEWLTTNGDDRIEIRSAAAAGANSLDVLKAGSPPQGWSFIGDQPAMSGNSTGALQGPDLARAISRTYWMSFAYITHAGVHATVRYRPHANSLYYDLEMLPQGGDRIDAYLDQRTFLPVQIRIGEPGFRMLLIPSNWRYVGGIRFPFSLTAHIVNEHTSITYTFQEIKLNLSPPPGAFVQPTPGV